VLSLSLFWAGPTHSEQQNRHFQRECLLCNFTNLADGVTLMDP